MATPLYSPLNSNSYGTVANSYAQMVGDQAAGPIRYNTNLNNLRSFGDTTFINTEGNGSTISDRVQRGIDKYQVQQGIGRGIANLRTQDFVNRYRTGPLMPSEQARNILRDIDNGASTASASANSLGGLMRGNNNNPLLRSAQQQQEWNNQWAANAAGYDASAIRSAYRDFLQRSADYGGGTSSVNTAWNRFQGLTGLA